MFDVRREDPCSLALTLRLVRRLRGIKQAHAGELLGVTQSTVCRIERGELKPAGALRNRLLDLVVAHIDPSRDAALRHLVEARPVRSIWSAISPIGCWPRPVRASANGGAQRTNCRASLDRLQPILLNHAVGGGTWADYDVDETRERTLACRIAEGSPALWRAAESVIEDAVRRGWLRPAPGA